MKIRFLLHTVYGHGGGGVLSATLPLAEELATRHEVEVVSLFRLPRAQTFPMARGVRTFDLIDARPGEGGESEDGWLVRRMKARPSRIIPSGEPRYKQYSRHSDVVLTRYLRSLSDGAVITMQPGLTVALARFGRPEVVRVGQDHRPFVDRSEEVHEAYRRYAHRLDAFLTLTKRDARGYRKKLHPRADVRAMTNGTPAYAGSRSTLSHPVVVAAGRLERTKGFDLLVEAWSEVARAHPEWRLRIFGAGSREAELRAQIRALGLSESVHLMGYSTRLMEEMAKSSLFVLSSRREGYGMVLVEAMAAGVPVVSFNCPNGPRDIIDHERNGLLVPNRDVGALGAAIKQMIEIGSEGRARMARAALETAEARSMPVIGARWEELLSELAARKSGSAPGTRSRRVHLP